MDLQIPKREQKSYKGTFGKVLNIAGSRNYSGAAYFSSISALKSGCGYVTLASVPSVLTRIASMSPDIVCIPIGEIKSQLSKYDVYSLGSGLSQDAGAILLFKAILSDIKDTDKTVIIDAEGLNIISKFPKIKLPKNVIFTPHVGEAARLTGQKTEDILRNPRFTAKKITEMFKCVTVLKSHKTVVCSKEGKIYTNNSGNSALAKAGTGDVLCGMIAGLSAQKMSPFEAACLAVYLHGFAGEIASQDLTEYSVLASDLVNYIPKAIKNYLEQDINAYLETDDESEDEKSYDDVGENSIIIDNENDYDDEHYVEDIDLE
ncbi:NAD(P)H-hydrate dehydratase [bacterium]|nr:NAD(P)H-hydrate dehydratase [bacterium]